MTIQNRASKYGEANEKDSREDEKMDLPPPPPGFTYNTNSFNQGTEMNAPPQMGVARGESSAGTQLPPNEEDSNHQTNQQPSSFDKLESGKKASTSFQSDVNHEGFNVKDKEEPEEQSDDTKRLAGGSISTLNTFSDDWNEGNESDEGISQSNFGYEEEEDPTLELDREGTYMPQEESKGLKESERVNDTAETEKSTQDSEKRAPTKEEEYNRIKRFNMGVEDTSDEQAIPVNSLKIKKQNLHQSGKKSKDNKYLLKETQEEHELFMTVKDFRKFIDLISAVACEIRVAQDSVERRGELDKDLDNLYEKWKNHLNNAENNIENIDRILFK